MDAEEVPGRDREAPREQQRSGSTQLIQPAGSMAINSVWIFQYLTSDLIRKTLHSKKRQLVSSIVSSIIHL